VNPINFGLTGAIAGNDRRQSTAANGKARRLCKALRASYADSAIGTFIAAQYCRRSQARPALFFTKGTGSRRFSLYAIAQTVVCKVIMGAGKQITSALRVASPQAASPISTIQRRIAMRHWRFETALSG